MSQRVLETVQEIPGGFMNILRGLMCVSVGPREFRKYHRVSRVFKWGNSVFMVFQGLQWVPGELGALQVTSNDFQGRSIGSQERFRESQ